LLMPCQFAELTGGAETGSREIAAAGLKVVSPILPRPRPKMLCGAMAGPIAGIGAYRHRMTRSRWRKALAVAGWDFRRASAINQVALARNRSC
jgi:hypothetical protein